MQPCRPLAMKLHSAGLINIDLSSWSIVRPHTNKDIMTRAVLGERGPAPDLDDQVGRPVIRNPVE